MKERLRNAKGFTPHLSKGAGFTLIELAIVLVIIGIIIGAILKGGDLIEGARHKRLASECRKWESLTWEFMDRKGYFPGDSGKDGTIGENPKDDLTTKGRFLDPPDTNSVTMGGYTFYLWLGNTAAKKNVIGITNSATSPTTGFSDDELAYMESFDTSIDGSSGGGAGRVRAATGVTVDSAKWLLSTATVSGDWTSATKALLYYFDRKP